MNRLAELGDDSVSQEGVRGLEFKAVLAELFLRLGELSRGGPAIPVWYDSSSIGRDSTYQAGQRVSGHVYTLRVTGVHSASWVKV